MLHKIYSPNVHLLAYHLHSQKQTEQNDLLWRKCENILKHFGSTTTLKIQDKEGQYKVDLLKEENTDNVTLEVLGIVDFNRNSVKVSVVVYPFRLHDTYGLALNLERYEDGKPIEPLDTAFLAYLNPEECFLPQKIGSSLGQTLLLTVCYTTEWYSKSHRQNLRELADECLEAFLPRSFPYPAFNQNGELFGNSIFEYGHPTLPAYCHILVWIFPEHEERCINQKLAKVYPNLIDLFCYRNKVITAYRQSCILHKDIINDYQSNKQYLQIITSYSQHENLTETDLQNFKTWLKEIPPKNYAYSKLIVELDQWRQTIETNTRNYQRELNNIRSQFPKENFKFLEAFIEQDCRLYQEQVQSDLGYFRHGIDLLDNAIRVISTRLEIEQTEQDRRLRQSLEAIGTGIGAGAIVASSSGLITQPWLWPWQTNDKVPHPFLIAVFLSIITALLARFIVKRFVHRNHHLKRLRQKQSSDHTP